MTEPRDSTPPPGYRLQIPTSVWESLLAHCRECLPNEACGLLLSEASPGHRRVQLHLPIQSADPHPERFATNPQAMLHAYRLMREQNLVEAAFYHSHPRAAPIPSQRDLRLNPYGMTVQHLIISLTDSVPNARSWWLDIDFYRAADFEIISEMEQTASK